MRVVHLSWRKRSEGSLGGVEKFAEHLHRALGEAGAACELVSWTDYPGHVRLDGLAHAEKALVLGAWAERVVPFDVAVADGYWGLGITRRPVVTVVHGTWAQFHANRRVPAPDTHPDVRRQHEAFTAPNALPVACSPAAAAELERHHGRAPIRTILHGIDLDRFCPRAGCAPGPRPIVLHAATTTAKGHDLIPAIARALGDAFAVRFLDARAGDEPDAFRRGDVFLHPSLYEGNAYALLEAMATGLPIVTSRVGLFETIADRTVGRVLAPGAAPAEWAAAVREVLGDGREPYERYARAARATAVSLADGARFAREWVELLHGLPPG